MSHPKLILALLFTICFSAAALHENSPLVTLINAPASQKNQDATGVLTELMGDSRRLFANHFAAKADAYFHSGYYPSIFDRPKQGEQNHLQSASEEKPDHDEAGHSGHHDEEEGYLGPPLDCLEAFGRNFFPSHHTHLQSGNERELLPWMKISAELDPHQIATYTASAFWLRTKLGKVKEAEDFLRDGLRENPDSYDIYMELATIYDENYRNTDRARTLYEIALQKWQKEKADGGTPDEASYGKILLFLSRLEERSGNLSRALEYLVQYRQFSPDKPVVDQQIAELRRKLNASPVPPKK